VPSETSPGGTAENTQDAILGYLYL
jgi:hypothetical protein